MNLAQQLLRSAREHADRPAIRLEETVLTYAELAAQASHVARWLVGEGLEEGDRVAIALPNVPATPVHVFGVLMAGGVVVPLNPLLTTRELEHHLGDSGARFLFASPEASVAAGPAGVTTSTRVVTVGPGPVDAPSSLGLEVVPRADEDTAVILYTSGTTGRPKGAELTHANLGTNAEVTRTTLIELGPRDVVMGCLPLFHVFGLTCGLLASVQAGACLTLIPRFDGTKALEVIARDGVTVFEGVPTMYSAMLQSDAASSTDVSSIRTCISGGAPLPVEVLREFEAAFGCVILEGYGLSESSPVACFNHPHLERRAGTIGVPVRDVSLRLVDDDGADVGPGAVGEILIHGPNVMKGYWGLPDVTALTVVDGWLRTGDLAVRDDDGYVTIVDRKKDLIIRGGFNVYPREVEEVLYECPAVVEAAVVGVPHDELGEEVAAAVVLRAGETLTVEQVQAFAKERLAPYKYPRHVWLVDDLPKGPTGKILRREVATPKQPA